ncbi:MAG TPA: Calx-beta domain-containing protein [Thermoanaerobaculia bacterium]|nr:Calx-beta domain-containing protein [Thermoanaerobaculia bacterium]
MLQRRTAVLCLAVLLLAFAPAARAITVDVQVGGDAGLAYSPKTVTIHVGDTVRWTNAGGLHNLHAEDNSFRCSNDCNSNNDVSSNAWSSSHTFNAAGTFRYYCDQHGGPGGFGMSGTVSVLPAGPQAQPGTLALSPASYSVSESAGSVTVHVSRTGGSDGGVSVAYAATAGTASAGSDFTPTSGTLTWGDQDSAEKTFQVAIVNDAISESTETVSLALSSPTGGAGLGTGSGTITIADDDAPGPTAPAAPSNLQATGVSSTDVQLTWRDNSNNETGFRIESKTASTAYQLVATAPTNATGATIAGLSPATAYTFHVRANGAGGNSGFSNEATAATLGDTAPCVAGHNTLCLGDGGRFKAEVAWSSQSSGSGDAVAVPLASAPQSGLFYFVDPSNIEMLVKVLNACIPALGNHYWVFYAATTNVQFTLTVTDTHSGQVKTYTNALNHAASPVQDTTAFATCP